MNNLKKIGLSLILTIVGVGMGLTSHAATIINHNCTDLSKIPDEYIEAAKSQLHVVYQHTSHGSQLITGMNVLENANSKFAWDDSGQSASALDLDDEGISAVADLSEGDAIDAYGVTPWVTATRELLDSPDNLHVNVVMWSWCSIKGHDIDRYLENMEILIDEYGTGGSNQRAAEHPVQFVFMTGHAEGEGINGSVHAANQKIRTHCQNNNRILYDFANIESYDPDGYYYFDLDMWDNLDFTESSSRDSNWAVDWIENNPDSELARLTSECSGCAHSDSPAEANLNCVLKGRAAWWLMARLAGWNTPESAPADNGIGSSSSGGGGSGSCFVKTLFPIF